MKKSLGAEWNHSVVVYRAVFDQANPLGTATLQMHCGWKDDTSHRSFVASISWFYECGYITAAVGKTTDCTHIYVPVPFAAKRSPNRIQPIGILCSAKCIRCGHTGSIAEPFGFSFYEERTAASKEGA